MMAQSPTFDLVGAPLVRSRPVTLGLPRRLETGCSASWCEAQKKSGQLCSGPSSMGSLTCWRACSTAPLSALSLDLLSSQTTTQSTHASWSAALASTYATEPGSRNGELVRYSCSLCRCSGRSGGAGSGPDGPDVLAAVLGALESSGKGAPDASSTYQGRCCSRRRTEVDSVLAGASAAAASPADLSASERVQVQRVNSLPALAIDMVG